MVNERTKMAESIDTVHTHTHTPYSYKQNWWTVWRELHFSKIKCLLEYGIILEDNYNLNKF